MWTVVFVSNQTGHRRVVVALRERLGRTVPFVVRDEAEAEGVALARANVDRVAIMSASEAP